MQPGGLPAVAAWHITCPDVQKRSPRNELPPEVTTKAPTLRLVLITLRPGARLHEHQATGPVTILPVSGSLRLQAADRA